MQSYSKKTMAVKSGVAGGTGALAVVLVKNIPWVNTLPEELSIPLALFALRAVHNFVKHYLNFDPFAEGK